MKCRRITAALALDQRFSGGFLRVNVTWKSSPKIVEENHCPPMLRGVK
jgi:hypothetical protein